jgi:hypothetical protein
MASDSTSTGTATAHGRAPGTRSERFRPLGVWTSVVVILLGCVGVGLGIILASGWWIGVSAAVVLVGVLLGWASGILHDTR